MKLKNFNSLLNNNINILSLIHVRVE